MRVMPTPGLIITVSMSCKGACAQRFLEQRELQSFLPEFHYFKKTFMKRDVKGKSFATSSMVMFGWLVNSFILCYLFVVSVMVVESL